MLTRLNRILGRQDVEHREIRGRQKEDGLQSPCHTPRNKWFWGKHRTARKASSTPFFLTEQEQQLNQVEKLKLQLQMMTNDRNELREFMAHYNNELNNRLNLENEMQNTEHKKDMSDVKKLPKEIREALYKCTELSEKTKTYSTLYSQHLSEQTQLKEKVRMLLEDKKKLQGEQILLQESCEEAKRLCEEAHEKIYDLWTRQMQEHQRLEENLQALLKQKELLTRQRDLAVKLQHHFTVSQMRFENLQQELEQTTAQEESLLQMELLGQKHYVPASLQKTEKAGRSHRHLEGMTFYTPGSRPPQKMPPLFSYEFTSEANINQPSCDPATI
ncbi:disks large homolog 5-like [Peromyscus maniculatus bairdii]|uniref:disks large homolog 5-like n=1 Tax=Peromyscus maniculatus bairdii TaxID=230844 RepID=UPI001C2F0883|nr:disks large homolog 5-like isoform X1 [Peromyscus maniculatus bairdii]